MIYVNTTGKHIGECLTGFGSSYPVFIYNSGNSDIKYDIDVLSNTDIFSVSENEFIINNGSVKKFDIFYKPTIVASTSTDTSQITIFSESVEDGTVDPSGLITINITGSRIITNTAGSVRKFIALKKYNPEKVEVSYDFRWLPPSGTGLLKNYYFTGYRLDLSTVSDFSSIDYSKDIVIARNNKDDPRFATYYGFPESEIIQNISKSDFPNLKINTNYYARIYTSSTNNTGISIYATGVDNLSDQLSEEVINGNSGNVVNIKIEKKALDVYIEQGNYTNYNLSKKIIETNNNSDNFIFISGINVFFPDNSFFVSSDYNNYAVSLNNVVLNNFTGNGSTLINFYIPNTCRIIGNFGKGGDVVIGDPTIKFIDKTTAEYNKTNSTFSDSQAGGNVFLLNAKTNKNETDFIYNIYVEKNSLVCSGGGGNKAGLAAVNSQIIYGFTNISRIDANYYYLNGAYNKLGQRTKYDLNYTAASTKSTPFINENIGSIFSNQSGYGEDGYKNIFLFNKRKKEYSQARLIADGANAWFLNNYKEYPVQFKPMPGTASIAGNLIKKYNNSSVRLSYYNNEIPSDYIFRLENTFLTSSSSWAAKNKNGSTIFTLNTVTGEGLTYLSNYNSTGYRSLTIKNSSLSGTISFFSDPVKNFDIYIVGCFNRSTVNPPKVSSMINWYKQSNNSSSKNILLKKFFNENINNYTKESNVFSFFFSLLYDYKIENKTDEQFFLLNKSGASSYYQLSSCLDTSSYNIYPFLLNIKRNGTVYSIYINGDLLTSYDLNTETPSAFRNNSNFLSSISGTTFKLENNDADGSGITTTFFDLLCYNRILFDDENKKVNNHLLQSYIKLFSGDSANNYLNINSRIRMPNAFNLAGYIST